MSHGLLSPGVRLMRRLRLRNKLLFNSVVFGAFCLLAWGLDRAGVPRWCVQVTLAFGAATAGYLMLAFYVSFMDEFGQIAAAVQRIAQGNLRERVATGGHDELAELRGFLDAMTLTLSSMVADIRSSTALVAHAGEALAASQRDLSARTEQQAANLEQTTASVEEISSAVQQNAELARGADQHASRVRSLADEGATSMTRAVASVEAIEQGSQRMGEIIAVIDNIAFQTNLLALNASVEAARAGSHGSGFAVVAGEVRRLAQRSAEASREIRGLIEGTASQVSTSVSLMRRAQAGFSEMADGIRGVAESLSRLSASNSEQSASLSEITHAARQLDEITQRNGQMVERAVTHAESVAERAEVLAAAVSNFELQQGTADEAQSLVRRALRFRQQQGQLDGFLRGITDPQRGFHDRDMYVFVLDEDGRYLAFAGNPSKVGTRVHDIPGVDGAGLLASIVEQARHGPGWVEYDITNPTSGQVQTKMSFVQVVDGLYLGCGVYKRLVA